MKKKARMRMVPEEDVKHILTHFRNQFNIGQENFKSIENVLNVSVSLRECIRKLSIIGG